MLEKKVILNKAQELGFADIGFTSAEPFDSQKTLLYERQELYSWTADKELDLVSGTNPNAIFPEAKSIIVLLENYYQQAFPASLEGKFGRCYLDDDRVTQDGMAVRLKAFRQFLRENGVESKAPSNLPHRLSAARAGVGTFGKNCLLYANRVARKSSWILPIALLVDHEFTPDEPTVERNCPSWCKNACIAACPTGALMGPGKINPRKCISYLSYYSEDIIPRELRQPMGMWVYGCDRCQNVCPRNGAWLTQGLQPNERVKPKIEAFDLIKLLHMDIDYFEQNIRPHMFYMSSRDLWRWKMNVARVMGNSCDRSYVPELIKAFQENNDERVLGMIAWALGELGGEQSRKALEEFQSQDSSLVNSEIEQARYTII